jgi:hypothetical protein
MSVARATTAAVLLLRVSYGLALIAVPRRLASALVSLLLAGAVDE